VNEENVNPLDALPETLSRRISDALERDARRYAPNFDLE